MNRRGFFKALADTTAAAAIGALVLPELELWTPKRTFFLPPVGGWAGSPLLTPAMIVNEALRLLAKDCQFVASVDRAYSDAFLYGTGTVRVRRPARYMALKVEHVPYPLRFA